MLIRSYIFIALGILSLFATYYFRVAILFIAVVIFLGLGLSYAIQNWYNNKNIQSVTKRIIPIIFSVLFLSFILFEIMMAMIYIFLSSK